MTRPNLDEIEARANAASRSPWTWFPSANQDPESSWETRLAFGGYPEGGYSLWSGVRESDAAFIAAAREDVPQIVAYARELEAENKHLRARDIEANDAMVRMETENARLRAIAIEAIDRWEEAADYKGDYLKTKHEDTEDIAKARAALGSKP